MLDTLERSASILPRPSKAVETNADASAGQMAPQYGDYQTEAWNELIDRTLIEWGRDPSILEDDDVVPPSVETVQRACEIAKLLRSLNYSAPTRIVPTGDGGISFESEDVECFESIEIGANGTIEYLRFEKAKLVERYEILMARPSK